MTKILIEKRKQKERETKTGVKTKATAHKELCLKKNSKQVRNK